MLDREALLEKIEQMPIEDLHALLCHVLDESGIDYEIAPGTIPFYGFEDGSSLEEAHMTFPSSEKKTDIARRYIALDNDDEQKFIFDATNCIKSTKWFLPMRYYAA